MDLSPVWDDTSTRTRHEHTHSATLRSSVVRRQSWRRTVGRRPGKDLTDEAVTNRKDPATGLYLLGSGFYDLPY